MKSAGNRSRDFICLVRKHDRHHLELKTTLPLPKKRRGRYDLNFYFYSPSQLHVTRERMGVQTVLNNVQTYTRFSSPTLPLGGLVDPKSERSPLNRIKGLLDAYQVSGEINEDETVYELQTLVNAFRGEVRGFTDLLEQIIVDEKGKVAQYKKRIAATIDQAGDVLSATRELFPQFFAPHISDRLRTALEWSDEAMSLSAERNGVRLHSICENEAELADLIPAIEEFVESEAAYRKQRNYESADETHNEHLDETIAYRASILKKWAQSAMYMKSVESKLPKRLNHMFAGTAAALAMGFAVLASIYAETVFVKNTAPWALILIISYVFKDRIKEVLRDVFGRLLPRLLADRIYRLIDPASGKDAAKSEVLITFGLDRDQPEEIKKARNMENNPFASILPPQNVLHYNRLVTLNSKLLRKNHSRLDSVTEITRVRIDEWLKEMDDPEEIQYKIVEGRRVRVSGSRVYHIHLLASLREGKQATPRIFHYCLVMNRSGILRIEPRS
ncbi:MAG: hypothetical protein ACQEQU_08665 [Spirochaetota bacterium]